MNRADKKEQGHQGQEGTLGLSLGLLVVPLFLSV